MESTKNTNSVTDAAAIAALAKAGEQIAAEVGKIIVGQVDVIGQVLTAFFARGHVVIEGVPGLACIPCTCRSSLMRSSGATQVLDTAPAMPPAASVLNALLESVH